MKLLPEKLLQSLEGIPGFEKDSFVKVHEEGAQVTSIRMNPLKMRGVDLPFEIRERVPWSQFGFYLDQRPSFTFDPLFHAGLYYVQEASSMFLEQALIQLANTNSSLKLLDLCAAPGGKSTHIQSLLSADSLLVSNEVIKSRCNILMDNIARWGSQNVVVTNNDPSAFSKLQQYFDVIVVDAPCSGSGLFRRDEDAIDEWSLNNVQLCCQRQRRILADVLPSLKNGGLLVYSTCSYSREEDEEIMDWIVEEMELENISLNIDASWNIITTKSKVASSVGYRFYPDKLKGEGLFMACFKKLEREGEEKRERVGKNRGGKVERASAKEKIIIQPWLKNDALEIIKERENFYALLPTILNEYVFLKTVLNIQFAGIELGQVMKDKLVPSHALALSLQVSDDVVVNELEYTAAIKYLQKQEIVLETNGKGWQLVSYRGMPLGWINVLPNRINNYYPKELRILKQQNDRSF